MEKAKHILSFVEGMDKDTAFDKYPNVRYLHSENFRFIYDEANSTGILTNDVGDKHALTLPGPLLGYTTIRDTLIMFIFNSTTSNLEIYQIPERELLENNVLNFTPKLTKNFGYTANTVVKAIGRYESVNIEKLYWTDGVSFKYCNLRDPNLTVQSISKFEAFPINNAGTTTITALTTGGLLAGKVQYGYQLYNVNGSATNINSLSRLVNITSSTDGHSRDFKGDAPGTTTNKGCSVTVSGVDTSFERIRLYRIFYTDFVQVPEVYLVDDKSISDSTMTFDDVTSVGAGQVEFEKVIAMSADILFNTMETKNNLLIVGDITEKVFDIDLAMSATYYDDANPPAPEELGDFTVTVTGTSISNPTPVPVLGAMVHIIATDGSSSYTEYTNANGIALFSSILKDVYNLEVSHPEYRTYSKVNIDTNVTTSQAVELTEIAVGDDEPAT